MTKLLIYVLQDRFDVNLSTNVVNPVEFQMNKCYRSWRCRLHKHFQEHGGEKSKDLAKQHKLQSMQQQEDFEWLCDYFGSKEFMVS